MFKGGADGVSYRDHSRSGVVVDGIAFEFGVEDEIAAVIQVDGTWTGTLSVDTSMDEGATWKTGVLSIASNGRYEVAGLEGYNVLRVSGTSSGSADILCRGVSHASVSSVLISGTVTDSQLHSDMGILHADLATTLHGDLAALPTAKGAGAAGATVARVVAASDSPDVVSLASMDTKLSTLHTDLATTLHADIVALPNAKGAGAAGATVARVVAASDSPDVVSLTSIDGKLLAATATATNASVAVSTTAVQLLASNSARKGLLLQNTGNSTAWIGFANTVVAGNAVAATGGIALLALDRLPPDALAHYTGAVWAICETGDSTFISVGSW